VKEQLAEFPAASVAVQVIVFAPSGRVDPLGGLQLTHAAQLSVAVGGVYVTTSLPLVSVSYTMKLAGQEPMTGAWLSTTVTLNEQLSLWLQPSEAVQFTVVVPTEKLLPEAGLQFTVTVGQPPLTGVANVTTAEH
jgi:hypothetical protein